MVDFHDSFARPRPLQRDEALELATDLLITDPAGMGIGNIDFAANLSWLTEYSLDLDPGSDDLHYFITAGENFYGHATQEQKDTRTFAECARMLAVAYSHIHEDRAKIVYYQECASRCPEVKVKLNKFLPDALVSFEKLLQQDARFPELVAVTEAGLAGARPGSERAALWAVVAGLARVHAADMVAARNHYKIAVRNETAKRGFGFTRLQAELKTLENKLNAGSSLFQNFNLFG
jgi:hypothetical protein